MHPAKLVREGCSVVETREGCSVIETREGGVLCHRDSRGRGELSLRLVGERRLAIGGWADYVAKRF